MYRTEQRITGTLLPLSSDLSLHQRCLRKATRIIEDCSHPRHGLFNLLPSEKRYRHQGFSAVDAGKKNPGSRRWLSTAGTRGRRRRLISPVISTVSFPVPTVAQDTTSTLTLNVPKRHIVVFLLPKETRQQRLTLGIQHFGQHN